MRARLEVNGDLFLRELSEFWADTFARLTEWSSSRDPRVRRRLDPDTFADPVEEEQWRRLAGSELEHLVSSSEEQVRTDLRSLRRTGPSFTLRIRAAHRSAWLSSTNAARLALFALAELTQADMDRSRLASLQPEKRLALYRIHGLAFLQEVLMHADEVEGPCELVEDRDGAEDDDIDEEDGEA